MRPVCFVVPEQVQRAEERSVRIDAAHRMGELVDRGVDQSGPGPIFAHIHVTVRDGETSRDPPERLCLCCADAEKLATIERRRERQPFDRIRVVQPQRGVQSRVRHRNSGEGTANGAALARQITESAAISDQDIDRDRIVDRRVEDRRGLFHALNKFRVIRRGVYEEQVSEHRVPSPLFMCRRVALPGLL